MKVVEVKDIKQLGELLKDLEIGDSVVITKSSIPDTEIGYNEFLLNCKASELNANVEIDCAFEKYRVKCTFIDKEEDIKHKYSHCIRINQEKEQPKQQELFTIISIKKGDIVELNDGFIGKIIKYPSNKEIHLEDNNKNSVITTKEEIKFNLTTSLSKIK